MQLSLFTQQKVEQSISIIQEYCPEEGYHLACSFGKDSVVLLELANMAGIKYDAHFYKSSVDPPEVLQFGREQYPQVIIDPQPMSMFKLIVEMGCPPTRRMRYCCRIFKEERGAGRIVLTGVRRSESRMRQKYTLIHSCPSKGKIIINPMLEWDEGDVWRFIHANKIPYCGLYDEGWRRIGCIGCPTAYWKTRKLEFERWPKFYAAYMHCFTKMLLKRKRKGIERKSKGKTWETNLEVMEWWLEKPRWK